MGDPRRLKKQRESPRKKWDRERLDKERKLKALYGLKNKKEIRRTETILRRKRQNARNLLPLPGEERQKREAELMNSLERMGMLKQGSGLDDVLGLSIEELLERRLQTIVWRKNLAKTVIQARQFVTHGHIAINGKKVNAPGYMVRKEEEDKIAYFGKPPLLEPKEDLAKEFKGAKGDAPDAEAGEKEGAPAKEAKEEKPVEEKKDAEGEKKGEAGAKEGKKGATGEETGEKKEGDGEK